MSTALPTKIVAVHEALAQAEVPHAFGGALALAWCTQRARGTIDIDVNIFLPAEQADDVLAAFPPSVAATDEDRTALLDDGQARLWWDSTPIDVFLDTTPFHHDVGTRVRLEPFGDVASAVPGVPRPRSVQGVLRPHQGLGRSRGDARGGDPRHRRRRRGARALSRRGRPSHRAPPYPRLNGAADPRRRPSATTTRSTITVAPGPRPSTTTPTPRR